MAADEPLVPTLRASYDSTLPQGPAIGGARSWNRTQIMKRKQNWQDKVRVIVRARAARSTTRKTYKTALRGSLTTLRSPAATTTQRICDGLGASRTTLCKVSERGRPLHCFLVRDRRSGRATQEMQRHRYAKSSITADITRTKPSSELKRRMIKGLPPPTRIPSPFPDRISPIAFAS